MPRRLLLTTAFTLAVIGCGGGEKVAPVSGRVLVDGKPMANLVVVFQPLGSQDNPNPGRGSAGLTDADGRFKLTYDNKEPGAIIGKHKVAIFTKLTDEELRSDPETGSEDGAVPKNVRREVIPPKYNDMTTLTFEVPAGGSDQANFELDSIHANKPGR